MPKRLEDIYGKGANNCAECAHADWEGGTGPICSEGFLPDFVWDPRNEFQTGDYLCDGCPFKQEEPKKKGRGRKK